LSRAAKDRKHLQVPVQFGLVRVEVVVVIAFALQ